jgi:hypothetical protein
VTPTERLATILDRLKRCPTTTEGDYVVPPDLYQEVEALEAAVGCEPHTTMESHGYDGPCGSCGGCTWCGVQEDEHEGTPS